VPKHILLNRSTVILGVALVATVLVAAVLGTMLVVGDDNAPARLAADQPQVSPTTGSLATVGASSTTGSPPTAEASLTATEVPAEPTAAPVTVVANQPAPTRPPAPTSTPQPSGPTLTAAQVEDAAFTRYGSCIIGEAARRNAENDRQATAYAKNKYTNLPPDSTTYFAPAPNAVRAAMQATYQGSGVWSVVALTSITTFAGFEAHLNEATGAWLLINGPQNCAQT
jgi:hypothetical protein